MKANKQSLNQCRRRMPNPKEGRIDTKTNVEERCIARKGDKRDTKANAEEGRNTRNENKRDTTTNAEGGRTQGTALCVGTHMSRGLAGPWGIRGHGRSSNHSGDDGGTQTLNEVQRMSRWKFNVGAKTRSANMVKKVEGAR